MECFLQFQLSHAVSVRWTAYFVFDGSSFSSDTEEDNHVFDGKWSELSFVLDLSGWLAFFGVSWFWKVTESFSNRGSKFHERMKHSLCCTLCYLSRANPSPFSARSRSKSALLSYFLSWMTDAQQTWVGT
jgi:hypothetical protein